MFIFDNACSIAAISRIALVSWAWASYEIRKIAGNAGNVSPPSLNSDTDMHHGTCATHVPWCMPLTSGFFWSRWRGRHSRHSWRMRNPQFYVSGKRPIEKGGNFPIHIVVLLYNQRIGVLKLHSNTSIHWGRVTHIWVSNLGRRWFR